eukprot:7977340-Heterocapsa_arctica.AAC.1
MKPQVEASPVRGALDVLGDGFLPLPAVAGRADNKAQVGAVVSNRNISPIGVGLVDSCLAKCVQATWEK